MGVFYSPLFRSWFNSTCLASFRTHHRCRKDHPHRNSQEPPRYVAGRVHPIRAGAAVARDQGRAATNVHQGRQGTSGMGRADTRSPKLSTKKFKQVCEVKAHSLLCDTSGHPSPGPRFVVTLLAKDFWAFLLCPPNESKSQHCEPQNAAFLKDEFFRHSALICQAVHSMSLSLKPLCDFVTVIQSSAPVF